MPSKTNLREKNKLIYGVGINDADYMVSVKQNGKRISCKAYLTWANMIKRCYYSDVKKNQPTYKGCTVEREWLTFSNFKKWFDGNYIDGYHLDKDLMVIGNKVYSPNTCLFVPNSINQLIIKEHKNKGGYPTGVTFIKKEGKYKARITIDSKEKYIDRFATAECASNAYRKAKAEDLKRKSEQHPEFAKYLKQYINFFNTQTATSQVQ